MAIDAQAVTDSYRAGAGPKLGERELSLGYFVLTTAQYQVGQQKGNPLRP